MVPRDCLANRRTEGGQAGDSALSSSVSETEEWVCSKVIHLNRTVTRGCQKTYTGGETFASCFFNSAEGFNQIHFSNELILLTAVRQKMHLYGAAL